MAKYKVVNETPTVADFWWRQPLVNADGSLQKTEDGAIKVEQMVVRTVDSEKLDKVSRFIDENGTLSSEQLTAMQKKLDELEKLIRGGVTPVPDTPSTGDDTMNYTIKKYTGASSYTLDASANSIFAIVLSEATSAIKIDSTKISPDKLWEIRIYLQQGSGSNVVNWPSNIKWLNGLTPALSYKANSIDIIQLSTIDGGVSWFGSYVSCWN